MAGMVVAFVSMFVVISIFSFALILVRVIWNVSRLKLLNPAQSHSLCLPGTDHHNHLLTSFLPLRELLIKLTPKIWSYILNCNLLSEVVVNNTSHLLNIIDIYGLGLTQLITEPTRVTQYSRALIDLCLTNFPDKVSKSGVIDIGISDHSAIYLTRKVTLFRSGNHKTVETRQLKNFNEDEFLRDLRMNDWNLATACNNPNEMWDVWKQLLTSVIDKHAPLRTKRIKNKSSPWITNELLREIHN